MRTASICPTCAIYENAKCILYDGDYLSNIDVDTLDSLQTALEKINTKIGTATSKRVVIQASQDTGIQNDPFLSFWKNDLAGTITATYTGLGQFRLDNTLPEFTADKTAVSFSCFGDIGDKFLSWNVLSTTQILITVRDRDGGLANNILNRDLIFIEILP